jgi:CBS-domain-containing membrane protein
MFLPVEWWSLGLAAGLAIATMAVLRVTHPPAGADPLVVFFDNPGWAYLGLPVALGSLALIVEETES